MEGIRSEDEVRYFIENLDFTHREVSAEMKERFPGLKGLSTRSVTRFCHQHDIHKITRISNDCLDEYIANAITSVGGRYGRKMMKGVLLSEHGLRVGDKRIARSMHAVAPGDYQLRSINMGRLLNPVPYMAEYYGDKVHVDQNEKLAMYGVTHVAVDGYSGRIVRSSNHAGEKCYRHLRKCFSTNYA